MTTTPVPASSAPAPVGPVAGGAFPVAPPSGQQAPGQQPHLHQAPTDRIDPLAHPGAGQFPYPEAGRFTPQDAAKPSFGAQMGARSTEFKNALIAGGVGIAVAFLAAGFGLGYWAGDAGSSGNTPQSGFSQMGGGQTGNSQFGAGQFGGGQSGNSQFGAGQFGGGQSGGTGQSGTGTQGGSLGGQTDSGTGTGTTTG